MTLKFAIVADDLTGALDTSTPFVAHGMEVVVAVTPDALREALASGAPVVAVNTASRALAPDEAASRLAAIAQHLCAAAPAIVMKKVDSRLKGNVGFESAALARGLSLSRLTIAPAVPDQQRTTISGAVVGRGVEIAIAIAPLFAEFGLPVAVADARTDADLDATVAGGDWSRTLAVGARGLGAAFARSLGEHVSNALPFHCDHRTLFAFGSRDPITARQIESLAAAWPALTILDAPDGAVPASAAAPGLPLLLRCTGELSADPETVAARFAGDVAVLCRRWAPDTLVMGGGDTALAVLAALGVGLVRPKGEAGAGMPWFEIVSENGHRLRCVIKSGGFGDDNALADLVMPATAGADLQ